MNPTPPSAGTPAPSVQVRVVQQPVTIGTITYLKNQTFFVTPERAQELGDFVQVVLPALAPASPAATATSVEVVVLNEPVDENGTTYTKGQSFSTTPERAEQLSALVSIVK